MYILVLDNGTGPKFWSFGYPGKWVEDKAQARMYDREQSAINARGAILRKRTAMKPEMLTIVEVEDEPAVDVDGDGDSDVTDVPE